MEMGDGEARSAGAWLRVSVGRRLGGGKGCTV